MEATFIIIAAVLPVLVWVYYIYKKDQYQPEPTKLLVKGFCLGLLSVLLSLCISLPLEFLGFWGDETSNLFDAIRKAFFGAAIPEEIAKFIMLWLLLRKNPFFDEHFDGIIYAVMVSMGFAALENIMYLFSYESWISVGIVRALISVPGHFFFGILMGYFYSLAYFTKDKKYYVWVLLAPILAHGLFDTLLFTSQISEGVGTVIMILFLVFFNKLRKYALKKMKELLDKDLEISQQTNENSEQTIIESSEQKED